MKFIAALLLLSTIPLFADDSGKMTDSERAYLVDQLEQSKKNMLDSISGLTADQWKFKTAPDRWSVAECAEHIVISEGFIFGASQKILSSPAVPRPAKSNAEVDHALIAGVTDRGHKLKAPEPLVPSDKFPTPESAASAFIAARDKSIEYAKTTNDDLRVHVGDGPAGPMDAYQFLLLMAAHSGRHTAQIREVEASPGYPKP